jgi:hypothetical protein
VFGVKLDNSVKVFDTTAATEASPHAPSGEKVPDSIAVAIAPEVAGSEAFLKSITTALRTRQGLNGNQVQVRTSADASYYEAMGYPDHS